MAAGLGTRMKSRKAKVLHQAGGQTLVEHVLDAAEASVPSSRITVVVGHQADQVRDLLSPRACQFVTQQEQRGTGHAVAVAFTAGNLEAVALALHPKYPSFRFVIAADNDHQTPGNPGMTKALSAAQAIGAALAVPTTEVAEA